MDDKSIKAAAQAARDYIGSCSYGASTTDIVCVAIEAYRDAEIERLTAENEALRQALDVKASVTDKIVKERADLRAKLEGARNAKRIAEERELEAAQEIDDMRTRLEAAERDAGRYREWRRAFREGECGLWNALCGANSEKEHDAAIDSARGGDRG